MEKLFIVWSDHFSVKVKEIDDQHKILVQLINDLYNAFMRKEHKEIIGDIINRMAEYAVMHFAAEEKYFEQFNYIDAEPHIAEHNAFLTAVGNFKDDFDNNKTTLTFQVMTFLQKWLTNHIIGSDKKFTKCFKDGGLE